MHFDFLIFTLEHSIKIAESIHDLCPNGDDGLREVVAGGKELCVTLIKGALKACAAKCPHAGARMAQGYVDAIGNIVCPLHRYRFELERGRNVSGEGYYMKVYRVEEREDGVYVFF